MANFKWIANASQPNGDDYGVAANLADLTAATPLPQSGDAVSITGLADSGIYRLGALYVFPPLDPYTLIEFFAPQNPITELDTPNAVKGYTVSGQTFNIDGTAGPAEFWLQNSTLLNDALKVVGTAVISSYLDSNVSGAITIGNAATTGKLQFDVIPADVSNVTPSDHYPVTTLNAVVAIARGSQLDVEAGTNAVSGFISNGAITVAAGGSLAIDDKDVPDPISDPPLVSFPFEHNLLFGNGGAIGIQGAPGQTTKASFIADVGGPGAITINGNGAAPSATTLLVAGYLHDQTITLADATIDVEDASTAIDTPGSDGFDVAGGSFTFADSHGVLILHQAELTSLQFNADDTQQIQTADGRHPFTTPISGFGAGDIIELPGKNLARFGLSTYALSYSAASKVLEVLSPDNIAGNPPEIIAALTFVGNYDGGLFHLSGDNATEELDITYAGAAPPGVALPNVSASFTSQSAAQIQSALAALLPAGATPSVVNIASGGAPGSAVSGTLNVLNVSSSTPGSTTALPTGFNAGYLTGGSGALQDTAGGAVLIAAAAGGTLIGANADTLFGGNAGETLSAATGAETLIGGTGANAFFLGASAAFVESQGADTITGSSVAATVNASGSALYFGTSGATDFIASGTGGDTIIGGGNGNTVQGGGGGQLIFGGTTLNYSGGAGAATIVGGRTGNTIAGGSGNELIFASSALTYTGASGAATIIGGSGRTSVNLGSGGGVVYGSPNGSNTLRSGSGAAIMVGGGPGDVLVATGGANDTLVGGGGAETLSGAGSTGHLVLFGGPGDEFLVGGTGNNLFIAESGNETLVGGGSSDSTIFIATPGTTRTDVLVGFNPNTDAIGLFGYGAEPGADQAALASAAVSGGNTVVSLTDGTTLIFTGAPSLNSYNFF